MSAGFEASTAFTTFCVKLINSSFLAQKSVSEFVSKIAPVLPSLAIAIETKPSAAILPLTLEALFPNLTLNNSSAFFQSPSTSDSAFLQSIIGASVISLNSFTNAAVISAINNSLQINF